MSVISERVQLARHTTYRFFGEANGNDDVYIEDILNCFVSLVQKPVDFAIYKNVGNKLLPQFHTCTDKKHCLWFENKITDENWLKNFSGEESNFFELFPWALEDYYISIHYMHTKNLSKNMWDTLILPQNVNLIDWDVEKYIAICGKRYFVEKWGSAKTLFRYDFSKSIHNSIRSIAANHSWLKHVRAKKEDSIATFPPKYDALLTLQREIGHPNSDKEDWHLHLKELMTGSIGSLEFGNKSLTKILYSTNEDEEFEETNCNLGDYPQNTIFAYRSFDRDDDKEIWEGIMMAHQHMPTIPDF